MRLALIGFGGTIAWVAATFFFANLTHTSPVAHDGYEVCALEFFAAAFATVCFIGIPALTGVVMSTINKETVR